MNVAILKKFTAIISAGIVALSTTVPVFASSQSVGGIDRDLLDNNYFSGSIYPTQAAFHVEGATNELIVPVFYNMSNFPDVYNMTYLSGYVTFQNIGINVFGADTSAPVNVMPEYFEPANTDTIQVAWSTAYSLRIYFNNYRILDNNQYNRIIMLGYIHYTFDEASSAFWYQFPTANKQVTASSSGVMYGSAYEYGFADSIAWAIANAQSTQDALDLLTYIEQDTRYAEDIYQILSTQYPLVLNALATIDQHVLQIYYQLAQMNAAQSSQAAEIAGEVEQKASQSAVLSNDMEVNKPQLSGDDINITGLIDTSVNSKFTGFLGALVQNNFITTMFLIALSCMIIGFVLYGKK